MAGTLTISTLSDGTNSTSATNPIKGSAKAWVNFNGVTTVTINNSFNVSSVTRNGAGDYTVNYTTAMANANYVPLMQTTGQNAGDNRASVVIQGVYNTGATTKTTTALRINTGATSSATPFDMAEINVAILSS
jgi:hypothetical protein